MSAAAVSPATIEPRLGQTEEDARWLPVLGLPCLLTVDLPLPGFKVGDFLGLHVGSVVGTGWGLGRDIPVQVNEIFVAWGELEGAGSRLAVRVTGLA